MYHFPALDKPNRENQGKQLSNEQDRRHQGYLKRHENKRVVLLRVVYKVDMENKHGWIQPEKRGYKEVKFKFTDLQCTGIKKINSDSLVEFRVKKRTSGKNDIAYAITVNLQEFMFL